jgi:hypothetical protein
MVAGVVMVAAFSSPALAQLRPDINVATNASATRPRSASDTVTTTGNLDVVALSERWHDVPQGRRLKLSVQIIDEVTELGNLIGTSMNELSDDAIGLKFDGRKRRAKLRLGTGEGEYLRFRLDSDWHFSQGKARIVAKLQLGIGEHHWNIELPDMEMAPTSVQGQRGVEIRIPLIEKKF